MPRAARKKPTVARDPLPAGAVLLGLDASSTAVGWAVFVGDRIRAADVIAHPKSWDARRRIYHNAGAAAELVEAYGVTHAILEWQSHKSAGGKFHAQGLASLGKAQGYLLAVLEERYPELAIEVVDERAWTRWGGRNLAKTTRAARIRELVPEYAAAIDANPGADSGFDACDAAGICLWRLGVVG